MNKLIVLAALAAARIAAAGEPIDYLAEGAPVYGALRPVAVMGAMKRLGVGELPEVKALRAQLGGLDVLDPTLLAPTGLDVAAPVVASIEPMAGKRLHHRLVAQLRDANLLKAFLTGMAASGQVPVQAVAADSPLGKLGVIASLKLPDGLVAIARVQGSVLILDAINPEPGVKPATPDEIARKIPISVKKPFQPQRGARALFAPESALVMYADGRKMGPLLAALGEQQNATCLKEWSKVPAAFDDVALAAGVEPDGVSLSLAWGGPGLALKPVDDDAYDLSVLKSAPAVLALYAANLAPFSALKRSGPVATQSSLTASAAKCGAVAWGTLFVRAWPQALGAVLAETLGKKADPVQAKMLDVAGQLRNVVLVLRDAGPQAARWAVGATLDAPARQLLELTLGLLSRSAATSLAIGKRAPKVYHLSLEGLTTAAGLETLPSGLTSVTVADSDESLSWSLKRAGAAPPAVAPPVAAAHLDGEQLARLVPFLHFSKSDEKLWVEVLQRLRRVDARLTSEGDLFRLTVRAPLKQ